MTTATLTAGEWNEIFSLPADGRPYNVQGIAFRAVHHPRTSIKVEQVIAETRFGTLRRRYDGKRWQATEYINGTAG